MSLDSQISDYVGMADANRRGVKISRDRDQARAFLSKVASDKVFWLHDGRSLSSLEDLRVALDRMDKGLFSHHMQEGRSDFAKWIQEVIGDTRLAKEIARCRTAKSASSKMDSRIAELKSRLA